MCLGVIWRFRSRADMLQRSAKKMEPPTLPEKIQAFLASKPVDEDGEPQEIKLLPRLKEEELNELERQLGFKLPGRTRDLLVAAARKNGPC